MGKNRYYMVVWSTIFHEYIVVKQTGLNKTVYPTVMRDNLSKEEAEMIADQLNEEG